MLYEFLKPQFQISSSSGDSESFAAKVPENGMPDTSVTVTCHCPKGAASFSLGGQLASLWACCLGRAMCPVCTLAPLGDDEGSQDSDGKRGGQLEPWHPQAAVGAELSADRRGKHWAAGRSGQSQEGEMVVTLFWGTGCTMLAKLSQAPPRPTCTPPSTGHITPTSLGGSGGKSAESSYTRFMGFHFLILGRGFPSWWWF